MKEGKFLGDALNCSPFQSDNIITLSNFQAMLLCWASKHKQPHHSINVKVFERFF